MNREIVPPLTLEISDSRTGLHAWLAVDSLINNRCCGGLRMLSDVTESELSELARIMTLKFGFLGIPNGGAKAGICCDKDASSEEKLKLLEAFAIKVSDALGDCVYNPHQDMNTNKQEIRALHRMLGMRISRRSIPTEKSGWYTTLTLIASIKVASGYLGLNLSKSTAAIEGFGKVGSLVAQGLEQLGTKVVAISTICGALYSAKGLNISELVGMLPEFGDKIVDYYPAAERINKEALLELNVDILSPCARGYSIRIDNAPKVKAKLICPATNTPITQEAEELLFERDVLSMPDFVSNSGGSLGPTMEFAGINPSGIINFIETHFSIQVSAIIKKSRERKIYPRRIAEEIAMNRFARLKAQSESGSLSNKFFCCALGLYRNGLVPKIFSRLLSQKYFERMIEGKI